jgi:hypothetical protein
MKLQFVNWWGEKKWQGFGFIKVSGNNTNSAFYVCYEWTILLGYLEIRKFRNTPVNIEEFKKYFN